MEATSEGWALPLRGAREALSSGDMASIDLVGKALRAAERCQQRYNAFSIIAAEPALEAAARSDERLSRGGAGSLEGLPIAVKDIIDTAGIETRYGSKAYLGHMPVADADVVTRLKRQGAVIIGKTTTHEFAWGVTTESRFFGDTCNPCSPDHIPGGSSGGMAAAVAAGVVAAGLGTDTGGSVRIPAALCGVVGFKPTRGLWSSAGIFPLSKSLDHPGLIGRGVDDVRWLAAALGTGPAGAAAATPRVAIIPRLTALPPAEEVGRRFGEAVAMMRKGIAVETLSPDPLFEGTFEIFSTIVLAEAGSLHFGLNDSDRIADYEPETRERLDLSRAVTIGDYAESQHRRRRFSAMLDRRMRDVDYLMMPTTPCTAPRRGEAKVTIGSWTGSVREALMSYTLPFNLAGLPAITIPLPNRGQGLPAGLQIIGRHGEDAALLDFAEVVEALLRPDADPHLQSRAKEDPER